MLCIHSVHSPMGIACDLIVNVLTFEVPGTARTAMVIEIQD